MKTGKTIFVRSGDISDIVSASCVRKKCIGKHRLVFNERGAKNIFALLTHRGFLAPGQNTATRDW